MNPSDKPLGRRNIAGLAGRPLPRQSDETFMGGWIVGCVGSRIERGGFVCVRLLQISDNLGLECQQPAENVLRRNGAARGWNWSRIGRRRRDATCRVRMRPAAIDVTGLGVGVARKAESAGHD